MPRTTAELVNDIIEVDDTISLTPFIEAANLLVNRICVPAKDSEGNLYYTLETELEVIERWLAAHFYAVRDPRIVTEGVSVIMTRFESKVDLHLNMTRYGQAAMTVDTSGALASWNHSLKKGKRKAAIHWLGTNPETVEDEV